MRTVAEPISRLIEELNKLPGIGPKSAKRLAYHLLRSSDEEAKGLAEAILTLKEKIKLCSVCFDRNLPTSSLWSRLADMTACTTCFTALSVPHRVLGPKI
jgi:recombinational DNA repair protein RecR